MTKYFVIADVHGFYDEMIDGLNKVGFDKSNPNHVLISLGDAMDRGPKPLEVVEYLVNLPRKILIRGNHEDLLQELFNGRSLCSYDITNGTFDTIRMLAEKVRNFKVSRELAIFAWEEVTADARRQPIVRKYLESLINWWEVDKYVFVHGWIPYTEDCKTIVDWRFDATEEDWDRAVWSKTPDLVKNKVWDDREYTIVCGHWDSATFHEMFEGITKDYSPFISEEFICCDSCTALSHKVNVFTFDYDETREVQLCQANS